MAGSICLPLFNTQLQHSWPFPDFHLSYHLYICTYRMAWDMALCFHQEGQLLNASIPHCFKIPLHCKWIYKLFFCSTFFDVVNYSILLYTYIYALQRASLCLICIISLAWLFDRPITWSIYLNVEDNKCPLKRKLFFIQEA